MRLRTFLLRRSIHTIITLLVVLVLLFVIFRLMPGDPTRFFLRPGQNEADREDLLVSFGFAKRVPAPGNGYIASFDTSSPGAYEITVTVNDTAGRTVDFYEASARAPGGGGSGEPFLSVRAAAGIKPSWDTHPGDSVTIATRLVNGTSSLSYGVNVTISSYSGGLAPEARSGNLSGDPPAFLFDWAIPTGGPTGGVGAYSVAVVVDQRNSTTTYLGYAGFAANAMSTSPFQLQDDGAQVIQPRRLYATAIGQGDRTGITVNVTSSGASVSSAEARVRDLFNATQGPIAMYHPLVVQENNVLEEFWAYMTNMLRGDFGKSLYTRQPVWDEIARRVGPSLLLFGSAVIISYLLGILIGAVLAWRRGSKLELTSIVISLFFYSMPVFWFGLILLWFFAFTLKWFPLGGFGGVDDQGTPLSGLRYVASVLHHMALPLLNLVILSVAGHILLMRNSMLEVMGEDYITTAKAKGLSERRIMYRHAARNALLPVVTAFALAISGTISGGVLTETIFSWPGMGQFLVTSTIAQDFPSVQGAFFLLALLTILANLVADVLYAYLDPRVRL